MSHTMRGPTVCDDFIKISRVWKYKEMDLCSTCLKNRKIRDKAPEMYEALKDMIVKYSDRIRENHPDAVINKAKSLLKEIES